MRAFRWSLLAVRGECVPMPLPLTSTVRAWAVEAVEYGRAVRGFRNVSYTDSMEASRPRREHRPIARVRRGLLG